MGHALAKQHLGSYEDVKMAQWMVRSKGEDFYWRYFQKFLKDGKRITSDRAFFEYSILSNLTCYLEQNKHFIFVHPVYHIVSTY